MWMTLAAAQLTGLTRNGALKFRTTIAAAMTPKQIAESESLTREWKPTAEAVKEREGALERQRPRTAR